MANNKPVKKIVTNKHIARQQREERQTRIILIVAIAIGAIILGLVLYGVIDQTIIRPRTSIARVGDQNITVREFESNVQYARMQVLNQSFQYYTLHIQFGEFGGNFIQNAQQLAMELMQPVTFGRAVLDDMIENLIIFEEAERRDITLSESEIDEAVQAAFGFFPDGTPTPTVTATILATPTYSETQLGLVSTPTMVPDESDAVDEPVDEEETTLIDEEAETPDEDVVAEIEVELAQTEPELAGTPEATPTITLTPTPYTTALFGQNIKEFNNQFSIYNFDINNLREVFRAQLLRERLIEVFEFDIPTTKNEVWARHILVETLEQAEEVLSRLDQGENFFDLAALYSIDQSNKFNGGDLGWFDEATMIPAFSEVAFTLEEGEISEPVETGFGFHIIQLIGKRESQVLPSQVLQLRQQAFNDWIAEQRTTREDIEVFDNWDQYVPVTPEVPQQFLAELFSQPQQ
ncbi:MAG: peptidylprolyl isomerase [Brevefilum sp.]